MKGGVRLWCETLHHITIHSMKGGVRRWYEIWHHITIHSMKGGVRLWCDTWHHITIHSMKGGVRLWCETWHHITIHSMKGGVRLWRDTWHHITLRACSGCMIVVMLCCYVRRYVQVCDGILRNALWWLHECCMGFVFGEERTRSTKPCVFPCQVAAAGDERYLLCAAGAGAVVVFCNEWLFLCT